MVLDLLSIERGVWDHPETTQGGADSDLLIKTVCDVFVS